jgi:CheY-like chemotaxis protein
MESQCAPKKILILDDEKHVVAYLDALLRDNGYETVSALDGEEGMEKVRNERPDLITLDITMPKKSGIRFYRELKDNPEFASIPVVVVTAVTGYGGDPDEFKRFLESRRQIPKPEGFIAKPIDRDELLNKIADLLG